MNFCGCQGIDSLGSNTECKINYWLELDVRSDKEKMGINIYAGWQRRYQCHLLGY